MLLRRPEVPQLAFWYLLYGNFGTLRSGYYPRPGLVYFSRYVLVILVVDFMVRCDAAITRCPCV